MKLARIMKIASLLSLLENAEFNHRSISGYIQSETYRTRCTTKALLFEGVTVACSSRVHYAYNNYFK